jgi:hypothetical protein
VLSESANVSRDPARTDRSAIYSWTASETIDADGLLRVLGAESALDRSGRLREERGVGSPQTLSEADRRLVAAWAADCADRVLGLFEAEAPDDGRPRALIARTRAFARGELNTAEEIRRRFAGGVGPGDVKGPAAAAAAQAAGQAVATCHMGAHALGAAAYAVNAAGLADPDRPEAAEDEIGWQLQHMSSEHPPRRPPGAGRRPTAQRL